MNDLLLYIDQIDQSVADSEINVLESLIASYDKAIAIIQESADDADLSAFEIFQEGEKWDKFKEDTKAPVLGNKDESVGKRILMAIPRLIQKLIAMIKNLFSKEKAEERKMDKDVSELEKIAKSSDNVQESMVDDSDGDVVQEGLRDELKKIKSEFSPKERKAREAEYAKELEDMEYSASQSGNSTVWREFKYAIGAADELYDMKMFSALRDNIQKADLSNAKDIMSDTLSRQKYGDYHNADYARLDRSIHDIYGSLKYGHGDNLEPLETFITKSSNIDSVLKNVVMRRSFRMINTSNAEYGADTPARRKRYIREHLSEIKEIRDSINKLHDKRRQTITCIDKFAKDLHNIWSSVNADAPDYKKGKTLNARVMSNEITKLFTDLNKLVHQTFVLNKSIADCWNGLMHAMKGDGKATIENPYNLPS